ncbi:MAG TPA: ATP-grasp domain-containing protein [Ktedonobacteraceae bacterium]|nr:ATP-grasp domain-containing protein [Ktedonobacteraceae bacterium]
MSDSIQNQVLGVYELLQETGLPEQHEQDIQPHKRNVTYDALVLDAKQRQALMTVRSLGRRGLRVAAVEFSDRIAKSRHVPAFSSRWCQGTCIAPGYEQQAEPFLAYLNQFLATKGVRALIGVSDGTVSVLREHREEIERQGVRVALAKESAMAIAVSKERTLEIAKRLGIGIPRSVALASLSEVAEVVRDIGLPAVVKPTESWSKQGVRLISRLVTTPDEARRAVEELTRFGDTVLFQQYLPGRRECVNFMYANGEMYARFAQWTKRTQPPLGGESTYRESMEMPEDTGVLAERLVREIDLEGYSNVQFRRDAAGKPCLMEINPRLTAGVEIAVRAGIDFPYLVYQWACGEPIDRVEGYRTGVWLRYLGGDFLTTLQAVNQRGRPGVAPPAQVIFDFFSAFLEPTGYDGFDWQDLRPTLTATGAFIDRVCLWLKKRS